MNPVYIRMAIYTLAPLVATLPGITYDSVAQTLLVDLETAVMAWAVAFSGIFAVFGKWGKK